MLQMFVNHEVGRRISVTAADRTLVSWTLDYATRPKPFVHPLRTPSGSELSLFEPHDHPWHRGLWFTIKYINGDNFWEEQGGHGIQRVTGIPVVTHPDDGTAVVDLTIDWVASDGATVVIRERRRIAWTPGTDVDIYDWTSTLRAERDLELDRTPYTTWGGYGGLSFRGTRGWKVDRYLLPDGPTPDRPAGAIGAWCDLSGALDGGQGLQGGLAILDHPDNPRAPSPWYAGGGSGTFINAAFLFHKPMTVTAGETLAFQYRALVHDGVWNADRLVKMSAAFVAETGP